MRNKLCFMLIVTIAPFILVSCSKRVDFTDAEPNDKFVEVSVPKQTELEAARESEAIVPEPPVNPIAAKAIEIVSKMTIEEKVGQMFLARCPSSSAVQNVKDWNLGGYVLFGSDFSRLSKDEVVSKIESYQEASKIKMFIAVDEEGGTVNRISSNKELRNSPFLSPQSLYDLEGWNLIAEDTAEKCDLLSSLGINVNIAPVCDVSTDSRNFIYARSFGQDAEMTAEYVERVVRVMNWKNMVSVLKHFPGYGDNADTHGQAAYDGRTLETLRNSDFIPFVAGVKAGAGMVMVSHIVTECIDPDFPASLSLPAHNILREELGFNGVIVTDDLAMGALKQYSSNSNAAVLAVIAGNDMICTTDFEEQITAVVTAVKNGEIEESTINESVFRIIKLKIEFGIIYCAAN